MANAKAPPLDSTEIFDRRLTRQRAVQSLTVADSNSNVSIQTSIQINVSPQESTRPRRRRPSMIQQSPKNRPSPKPEKYPKIHPKPQIQPEPEKFESEIQPETQTGIETTTQPELKIQDASERPSGPKEEIVRRQLRSAESSTSSLREAKKILREAHEIIRQKPEKADESPNSVNELRDFREKEKPAGQLPKSIGPTHPQFPESLATRPKPRENPYDVLHSNDTDGSKESPFEEERLEPVNSPKKLRNCCRCCARHGETSVSSTGSETEAETESKSEFESTKSESARKASQPGETSTIGNAPPASLTTIKSSMEPRMERALKVRTVDPVEVCCPECARSFNVFIDCWDDDQNSEETMFGALRPQWFGVHDAEEWKSIT